MMLRRRPATGRLVAAHDPIRDQRFRSAAVIAPQHPVRRMWATGPVLAQGRLGACVAFTYTAALIAEPYAQPDVTQRLADRFARALYYRAKYLYGSAHDPRAQPEGLIDVWALDVLRAWGALDEYRWAKSLTEVRDALIAVGPVAIGVTLYTSMTTTARDGLIRVDTSSGIYGGHELLITGYDPAKRLRINGRDRTVEAYRIRNSWGRAWGAARRARRRGVLRWLPGPRTGDGWITATDLDRLLAMGAYESNACVPFGRGRVDLAALLAAHPDPLDPPLPTP